jgi:hypothetical protein
LKKRFKMGRHEEKVNKREFYENLAKWTVFKVLGDQAVLRKQAQRGILISSSTGLAHGQKQTGLCNSALYTKEHHHELAAEELVLSSEIGRP